MQVVHEFGHVLAAWCSRAGVERVVLLPISRTDTAQVAHPLFVYGAGAVFGAVFPVFLWQIVNGLRLKTAYLFRFFAGFCLVANGAYIGCDFSVIGPTDAGLLIEHGANRLQLVVFGIFCVSSGLFLWHGQSQFFFVKRGVNISPKQLVAHWVELFNAMDVSGLAELYHDDAINHQVANEPVEGKENIRNMFEREFAAAKMVCIVENLFEDGEWAILEWRDPLGLRGCGFFHVVEGKIKFQRGYWDKLSFLRQQGLPLPTE
jgi:limonene-1,2-epoxide hydrolase